VIAARIGICAGLVGIAFVAGCKVDQAAFDNRIFACDPSAKDPGCGSDSSGKAMVCYPASLLDGTDFCAPSCGTTAMSLPDGNQCVEGAAELQSCNPNVPDSCGQTALGCLRTDVTSDEGICTTMIPCTADTDCKDPVRSTCVTTFLTQLYAKDTALVTDNKANNLYCLQKNCQSGSSSCSPGQSCLPLLVPASAHAPDICVPDCDSQGNCPPNHVCFQKISGPANPAICIPGLLGFICDSDINCLVGHCMNDGDPDTTYGLNLCTITCNSDADCAVYDSAQGTFSCITRSDGHGYCETPNAYRGNSCRTDDECTRDGVRDPSSFCFFQAPPEKATDLGTCLRRCASDGACAPRAGIGQTCLPFYTPGGAPTTACYPGFFPYPCESNLNCVGDLGCRNIDSTTGVGNCTILCATNSDPNDPDADCHNDRWIGDQAFCATPPNGTTGLCAPLLAGGKPCLSSNQCQSKNCLAPADGGTSAVGTCAEPTP
jgi:hypothetical protein